MIKTTFSILIIGYIFNNSAYISDCNELSKKNLIQLKRGIPILLQKIFHTTFMEIQKIFWFCIFLVGLIKKVFLLSCP